MLVGVAHILDFFQGRLFAHWPGIPFAVDTLGHLRLGVLANNNVMFGEFACPLEKSAVNVEHIAGVGFTARGTSEQKRYLPVSRRLL